MSHPPRPTQAALDWSAIDTVLLDMDGTLLDQRFDNWFWQELIPQRYAEARSISPPEAWALLAPKFRAVRGTIQWYCLEYWSRELGMDIAGFKRAALEQVDYLPGARQFLAKLKLSGKRRVLVTNAHPMTLAIKNEQAGIAAFFDACYSTHEFHAPKEDAAFWPRLEQKEPFVPERTLMVDDSVPVLDAASNYGIAWLRAVRLPDSGRPAQETGAYAAVDGVAELM
jgi:putative hydrolase of the HAD superfamily